MFGGFLAMGVPVFRGRVEIAAIAVSGAENGKDLPGWRRWDCRFCRLPVRLPGYSHPRAIWPGACKDSRMNSAAPADLTALAPLDASVLLDPLALAIVFGGTAVSVVLRHRLGDVGRGLVALRTLLRRPFDAAPLIAQAGSLERIARRHGLIALDRSVIVDPDMAAAVAAAVDGATPSEIEAIVRDRATARAERHRAVIELWSGVAEAAPAMGLIGTILGLVRMFAAMEDPDRIGAAMAVALLATLYGALLANLVAMPIVARLKRLARVEAAERLRLAAPLARLATLERGRKREIAA